MDRRRLWRTARQTKDARLMRRAHAVLAVAVGLAIPQVLAVVGVARPSLYRWLRRYLRHHRVEDLADKGRSGRPAAAQAISDKRILREFQRDPLKLGYRCTSWTVPLLAAHLRQRYGSPIGPRTLRRRLRNLGLVWKRPRHQYQHKAPHVAQKKGPLSGVCGPCWQ